jgi:hypothetical protein
MQRRRDNRNAAIPKSAACRVGIAAFDDELVMTIDLRFATPSDIPALVELGRVMHVESRYGWMVYSADRAWKRFEEIVDRKDRCVMLAADTRTTDLAGFLVGTTRQYDFANDYAADLEYVYVTVSRRRGLTAMKLLTAFRRWAINRGVAEVVLCNRFGTNEAYVAKLFHKLNMPAVGGHHAAWVDTR